MGYANIIFDFDGTITDSKHDIAGAQVWVLHQLGVTRYAEKDLFRHIGKTLEETFSTLLPVELHDRIPDAAKMYSDYYQPRSLNTTTLFTGVKETLNTLHAQGKKFAVASTKRGPGIKRATDHFGITHYFAQLQGSEGIPHKPDPTIIRKILTEQEWDPAATLMVGDTDKDVLAGRNAGIATCGVTYGSLTGEELLPFKPDHIISDFSELLSIV
jgi:HAD superfamily hydrolase (TIGR01549 family)